MDQNVVSGVTTDSPHVLAVDDEVMLHDVLERLFPREGIEVTTCSSGTDAVEVLDEIPVDLVLADAQMPQMGGMDLLDHIQEHHPEVSVILLSAQDNVQNAVHAMRNGAADYIPRPFSTDELVERVKDLLQTEEPDAEGTPHRGDTVPESAQVSSTPEKAGPRSNGHARAQNGETGNGSRASQGKVSLSTAEDPLASGSVQFVGEHQSIRRLRTMVLRVAQSRAPVFVHGESGTGKEILSRLVHEKSNRANGPYVPINCAALPSDLVESHLFGHVKGAFTGAVENMEGAFERADGGTLLLDEITEISCAVQAKLLRVLQNQQFEKVGASEKMDVNVRVVATSNRNLQDAVQEGHFREDLYHRLAVFPMHVPPLRGRLSDIPLLAEHFVQKYTSRYGLPEKTIAPDLLQQFQTYSWPGNVRELENVIHRGVVMAGDRDAITQDDVFNNFFANGGGNGQKAEADDIMDQISDDGSTPTIDEMERKLILRTLADEDVSQKRAAEKLGVSPRTIRNKLQEYREQGFSV